MKEAVVTIPISQMWNPWTTAEGVVTFFAPKANIELRVGGPYELYFDLKAPIGFQGTEGCNVLHVEPQNSLGFEFIAPLQFPNIRRLKTRVDLDFKEVQRGALNKVALVHSGFLSGEEWDAAFEFFNWSWDLVLARFQHRLSSGPIDWKNPYFPPWLPRNPQRKIRDHISASLKSSSEKQCL
ncbi:MAG TPA: SRPBCC domain-containing protein [Candidatus Bathyarchaeia archaeon]|nr:SRPBCC domain-containing protein [Candidatus Bathyarchaeia archaeon]